MKRAFGVVLAGLVLGIMACGKLKTDDAGKREPKLGPAPEAGTAGAEAAAAGRDSSAPPAASPAADSSDINQVRPYASIKDLASGQYAGCESPVLCKGLAYFDCNVKGGGPSYYYDTATVAVVSRCGSHCVNADAAQKAQCDSACPPQAWAGCPGT